MRNWNYRVIGRTQDGEVEFGIFEVYYGEAGDVVAWTESRVRPFGTTLEELRSDLVAMGEALEEPVLNAEDLPGAWSQRPRTADGRAAIYGDVPGDDSSAG